MKDTGTDDDMRDVLDKLAQAAGYDDYADVLRSTPAPIEVLQPTIPQLN